MIIILDAHIKCNGHSEDSLNAISLSLFTFDSPAVWPNAKNFSCPCRGYEMLCRFQQLTALPPQLPSNNLATL